MNIWTCVNYCHYDIYNNDVDPCLDHTNCIPFANLDRIWIGVCVDPLYVVLYFCGVNVKIHTKGFLLHCLWISTYYNKMKQSKYKREIKAPEEANGSRLIVEMVKKAKMEGWR